MTFKSEAEFEEALVNLLSNRGWEKDIIKHPTEKDLIRNWANILFENNREIDRLNNYPLTDGEMQQIIEQITMKRTPLKLNGFINGRTVSITRDNPDDTLHFGKEISLKIYDRREIAAGQSRYQIVQQPEFAKKNKLLNDRRGDLMLLINGMPVIHIELKKSNVSVTQACEQIKKYAHEGVFTGLFSLVQVFVAMNPDETLYFANPGPDGKFNSDYYFHWADFDNEPINDWKSIASTLLSIPMAHQLIGFYTVADEADGILKVMRSYQYFAASAIADKVSKTKWGEGNQLGGYIWHTTGSGKTMTSFKSAQLIANSGDADKVVFLTDRIELGTQSLKEYRAFAEDSESVQETENTGVLINKLKNNNSSDTLIVTSIQKMSNIKLEAAGVNARDIEIIRKKRLVFIVDEAHRSTFGEMLLTIKDTFPDAIFFGFTGTPIHDENAKNGNTTATVFGDELHRYSIADGIRDENVLGFDIYMVQTFKDKELRLHVALDRAKASSVEEALRDPKKAEVYRKYMDVGKVKMAGYKNKAGEYIKGIEDYVPKSQYNNVEHRDMVVRDIEDNWSILSQGNRFHAIFATSSIPIAIEYYRLIKERMPQLKTTCLFDPNIDNMDGAIFKEEGLVEIISDYNKLYDQEFSIATHANFKKDIALRLAHKEHYRGIENAPDKQLDLLIVVDQMLTGFDSKWINTLYMDKIMMYADIIQAFSRTNRLFGESKPHGTIRYYKKPHTMTSYINDAVKSYSGDKPIGLFVQKIGYNIAKINMTFAEIEILFKEAGIANFEKLPEEKAVCAKFASLFNELSTYIESAKVQGLKWDKKEYPTYTGEAESNEIIELLLDKVTYDILLKRYQELQKGPGGGGGDDDIPYDIKGYLIEVDTGFINAEYMNSRFDKYMKLLNQDAVSEELLQQALDELHKTFATLSQEEQKYANLFLHDVQRGDVIGTDGKTLRDYITEYQYKAKDDQIYRFATVFGLDEEKLRAMISQSPTNDDINKFGRFDELKKTVDKTKAKNYFEKIEGRTIIPPKVNQKMDLLLKDFILDGGFELQE